MTRDSLAQFLPYFDELAVVEALSPTAIMRGRNIIRWETDCRNPAYSDIIMSHSYSPNVAGAIDLTAIFPEYGEYTVTITVWNKFGDSAWTSTYLHPICAGLCTAPLTASRCYKVTGGSNEANSNKTKIVSTLKPLRKLKAANRKKK
jgi:hypothetical protein